MTFDAKRDPWCKACDRPLTECPDECREPPKCECGQTATDIGPYLQEPMCNECFHDDREAFQTAGMTYEQEKVKFDTVANPESVARER